MVNRGYHKDFSAALQAVSGELGIIIPPSIAMILYGVSTGTSIRDMFIAGIIPGIMIGVTLLIAVYVIAKNVGIVETIRLHGRIESKHLKKRSCR